MAAYLDHAATTPLRAEARDAWMSVASDIGNASSIHGAGQRARRVLEESRERLAAVLGCDAPEVVLTSGGTEAVNLAITGLWRSRPAGRDVIVVPDGEHHATLDAAESLIRTEGAVRGGVPLDGLGRIDVEVFAARLPGAACATALAANNEVGTVNRSAALAAAAAAAGVPFHLDAVAAFGHVPVDFREWRGAAPAGGGLVAMSVSAHKIGGPVGVGALVVARDATLTPLLYGGAQQRGLRPGTADVAGAAAFAVAAEASARELGSESLRLRALGAQLTDGIRAIVPDAVLLGDPSDRIPGNVHVLFPGAVGETLLFLLDQAGVEVSTGSACQAGVPEPSHVVLALGRSDRDARAVLRMSLGRTSSPSDVTAFLAALPAAHARAVAAASR